jgi:parvulin-like peptidyl-prolyl isomerase
MPQVITIDRDEIFRHIQLSCQVPTAIEKIATCKIILSTAAEIGIQVEPEELQRAADRFRLANQLYEVNHTCIWLQDHHLSLDDFEELIRINLISEKLAQYLFADQVKSYFYEHQLNYASIIMYEIILQDNDLAMEIFYALQEGEVGFHEVAHQYIQDDQQRRCGGFRGILRRADLKPEISAAVFAATPPQILKPIPTSKGIHLILVEEIIQPQLNDSLYSQILADLFFVWLKQQLKQVEIMHEI